MAMTWFSRDRDYRAEYPVLVLLSAVGMGMMVSASDLLTLYVGLELQSLAAYVLASFQRSDTRSAEALKLEADIEGEEVRGGDHHPHAHGGEQDEQRIFGAIVAVQVLFSSVSAIQVAGMIGLSLVQIAAALCLAALTVYKLAD